MTLTFDPSINRVSLLPKMDVWTKFEEGRPGVLELLIGNTFDPSDIEQNQ